MLEFSQPNYWQQHQPQQSHIGWDLRDTAPCKLKSSILSICAVLMDAMDATLRDLHCVHCKICIAQREILSYPIFEWTLYEISGSRFGKIKQLLKTKTSVLELRRYFTSWQENSTDLTGCTITKSKHNKARQQSFSVIINNKCM